MKKLTNKIVLLAIVVTLAVTAGCKSYPATGDVLSMQEWKKFTAGEPINNATETIIHAPVEEVFKVTLDVLKHTGEKPKISRISVGSGKLGALSAKVVYQGGKDKTPSKLSEDKGGYVSAYKSIKLDVIKTFNGYIVYIMDNGDETTRISIKSNGVPKPPQKIIDEIQSKVKGGEGMMMDKGDEEMMMEKN